MPTDKYTYMLDLRGYGGGTPVEYLVDSAVTDLKAGEMVAWAGSTSRILKRFVRASEAGKFVGLTKDSQSGVAKLGNQTALAASVAKAMVFTTGVHLITGTAAEVYGHGMEVYMSGTDTQKITLTPGGGTKIGRVHLPNGNTKTGAVEVPILIDDYTITQS